MNLTIYEQQNKIVLPNWHYTYVQAKNFSMVLEN